MREDSGLHRLEPSTPITDRMYDFGVRLFTESSLQNVVFGRFTVDPKPEGSVTNSRSG